MKYLSFLSPFCSDRRTNFWVLPVLFSLLESQQSSSFTLKSRYPTFQSSITRKSSRCSSPIILLAKSECSSSTVDSHKESSAKGLQAILHKCGFDKRLIEVSQSDLPITAEVSLDGKLTLCEIVGLRPTTFQVKTLSNGQQHQERHVVDIGQVTTIWDTAKSKLENICSQHDEQVDDFIDRMPVGSQEELLESLYKSHVGKARSSSSNALTKKQMQKMITQEIAGETQQQHAANVLRPLLKSGKGCSRLVDSASAAKYMKEKFQLRSTYSQAAIQAVAAHLLAQDEGRFKRLPCSIVEQQYTGDGILLDSLTIINGGWFVVDQSSRAGNEARNFANKVFELESNSKPTKWTLSDERIAQRLECLAMGEALKGSASDIELDVRETLQAMNLPISPEGAQQILIQCGRWSPSTTATSGRENESKKALAWSATVLEAADWYAAHRRQERWSDSTRTDLTKIPFVCVDAAKTTFRDDAFGVRLRQATGRKVSPNAKWEILISIVDVSDIYVDSKSDSRLNAKYMATLKQAAASRGISRYDLPRGPLHLMPPTILEALSFETIRSGRGSKNARSAPAVTVWAYVDPMTGKLLDAGVERSVVSPPEALSYQEASALLGDENTNDKRKQTRQLLVVVERHLMAWKQQRLQASRAAKKREERLALKEFVARQNLRGHGSSGFRRTRGHLLVDASLDMYSHVLTHMLRHRKAFIPQQAGSGRDRGGRVATAPLRRYVDGMAQRQVLSVLTGYGDSPLTKSECIQISQQATNAYNNVYNTRSVKDAKLKHVTSTAPGQRTALANLKLFLQGRQQKSIPALSTGRGNEVVIKGVGAMAKCKGVQELKPGQEVLVAVKKLDVESGALSVALIKDGRT